MLSLLLKLSRWEVQGLNAEGTSVASWEEFQQNPCWRVIEDELKLRDAVLMGNLRYGDELWSDDNIRARLNELEYVLTLPKAIMTDLRLSQQNQNKTNNDQGE